MDASVVVDVLQFPKSGISQPRQSLPRVVFKRELDSGHSVIPVAWMVVLDSQDAFLVDRCEVSISCFLEKDAADVAHKQVSKQKYLQYMPEKKMTKEGERKRHASRTAKASLNSIRKTKEILNKARRRYRPQARSTLKSMT